MARKSARKTELFATQKIENLDEISAGHLTKAIFVLLFTIDRVSANSPPRRTRSGVPIKNADRGMDLPN